MEINIKVTVELPEWAEALVKSIANNVSMNVSQQAAAPAPAAPNTPATKPAAPAAPAKPAEKPAEQEPAKPAAKPKLGLGKTKPAAPAAPAKPAEKPAEEEAPAEEAEHTLDELRGLLKSKFEGNRETIKAKLTELGAASLSTLDASNYDAMYDFLIEL